MDDLIVDKADRMMRAQRKRIAGKTEIDRLGSAPRYGPDPALPVLIGRFRQLLELVQDLTELLLFISGNMLHLGE